VLTCPAGWPTPSQAYTRRRGCSRAAARPCSLTAAPGPRRASSELLCGIYSWGRERDLVPKASRADPTTRRRDGKGGGGRRGTLSAEELNRARRVLKRRPERSAGGPCCVAVDRHWTGLRARGRLRAALARVQRRCMPCGSKAPKTGRLDAVDRQSALELLRGGSRREVVEWLFPRLSACEVGIFQQNVRRAIRCGRADRARSPIVRRTFGIARP